MKKPEHTEHKLLFTDSRDLALLSPESIELVVTSPPYPMITMWDNLFGSLNQGIKKALDTSDARRAFRLMHEELDKVWNEVYRLLIDGGFACINIGDAVRSVAEKFQLFPNHTRILNHCFDLGFDILPAVLWRKQTNAPNKFMGSGMLPAGAYVTLEHEYILILRKNNKRNFSGPEEKLKRRQSAFFWEERNSWFSDIWDFKGTKQDLNHKNLRNRSGAFPFELAYRLINMYSVKGDTVLDPFLGTGTTMFAAMASGRNSIGVEIDYNFQELITGDLTSLIPEMNDHIKKRLNDHLEFVAGYTVARGPMKHWNNHYNFPVTTSQETELFLPYIAAIEQSGNTDFKVTYSDQPLLKNRN
jgi:DNA modification methylase